MRGPLIPTLLFSGGCAVVLLVGLRAFGVAFEPIHAVPLAYLSILSFLSLQWQERAMVTDPKGFVRRFMTGLVGKMLFSMIVLLVLVLLVPRPQAIPLALSFGLLYLAFLVFTSVRLTGRVRNLPRA